MIILRIEHKVQDFNGWKKVFDSDPLDRKKSGVKSYKIFRPADDQNFVIIDLEFEKMDKAEKMLSALNKLWGNIDGKIVFSPQTKLLSIVEAKNL